MRGFALLIALVSLLASPLPAAAPQDCPRGDLDPRYCDRDGDLVADPPDDPAALTAYGTLPVLYPATWSRPARIASISAAFDCTGKNETGLPVAFSRCLRNPSQDFL